MSHKQKGFRWGTRAGIRTGSKLHGVGKLESLHPAGKVGAGVTSTTRDQNQYHGRRRFGVSDSSVTHEGNHSSLNSLEESLEGDVPYLLSTASDGTI